LDYFGTAVDRAGDVNGDGYGDLIIGAEGYSNGQVEEGAVYLYLGGPAGPSAEPDAVLEIDAADAHFGFSVAAAGDVNGDGYSDILVGSSADMTRGAPICSWAAPRAWPARPPGRCREMRTRPTWAIRWPRPAMWTATATAISW
jgi:hypothetical protein